MLFNNQISNHSVYFCEKLFYGIYNSYLALVYFWFYYRIGNACSNLFWKSFRNVIQPQKFVFNDRYWQTGFFFNWDWKSQRWNLVVVFGAMIGGYVATHYLSDASNVTINPATIQKLQKIGIDAPHSKLLPDAIFGSDVFQSPQKIFLLIVGGILIGFGSRYAGGCTSGHAISGLSNFQLPSLKAVIGFLLEA